MSATTLTVAKAVSYRVVSTAVTIAMTAAMTGSIKTAAMLGLSSVVVSTGVYVSFEKAWGAVVLPRVTAPAPA